MSALRAGRLLGVVALTVAAVLVLLVPVVTVASHLGEPSMPDADAVPALPEGVAVVRREDGCGSGSCYREVLLAPAPGETPSALLARLDLPERCGAGSLFDRRTHCTGAVPADDGRHVRVYASIG